MITIVQSTACCVTGIRDIKPCVLEYLLACPEPWASSRQSTSRWVITPVIRLRTSNMERGGGYPLLSNARSCLLVASQLPSLPLSEAKQRTQSFFDRVGGRVFQHLEGTPIVEFFLKKRNRKSLRETVFAKEYFLVASKSRGTKNSEVET